jgi:FtsP/CotA-like multicopper oxidase with cupredoxin domain
MHPTNFSAALAVACLLWMPASTGSAEAEQNMTGHAHNPASDADTAVAAFEGTVIERTLGEGPSETIAVTQGAAIRLVLHAPAGTEVHLHGYDLRGVAGSDAPVVMTFRARHLGRFPIEAHEHEDVLGRREKALAYIEVRPE